MKLSTRGNVIAAVTFTTVTIIHNFMNEADSAVVLLELDVQWVPTNKRFNSPYLQNKFLFFLEKLTVIPFE